MDYLKITQVDASLNFALSDGQTKPPTGKQFTHVQLDIGCTVEDHDTGLLANVITTPKARPEDLEYWLPDPAPEVQYTFHTFTAADGITRAHLVNASQIRSITWVCAVAP